MLVSRTLRITLTLADLREKFGVNVPDGAQIESTYKLPGNRIAIVIDAPQKPSAEPVDIAAAAGGQT